RPDLRARGPRREPRSQPRRNRLHARAPAHGPARGGACPAPPWLPLLPLRSARAGVLLQRLRVARRPERAPAGRLRAPSRGERGRPAVPASLDLSRSGRPRGRAGVRALGVAPPRQVPGYRDRSRPPDHPPPDALDLLALSTESLQ